MLRVLIIVAAAIAALSATAEPQRRTIEIDREAARNIFQVRTSPGLSTTISFPEGWVTPPICGDCVFGDTKPSGQLFRLDVAEKTSTLSIKPTRAPADGNEAESFVTNIDLTLKSGVSVTIFARLVLPEEADLRVDFQYKAGANGLDSRTRIEREVDKKFTARVQDAATEKMLDAFIGGTKCRDFTGQPRRKDGFVVRVRQICRTGSYVYAVFEAENRKKVDLLLGSATLSDDEGKTSASYKFAKPSLAFNERVRGVVLIPIESYSPSSYRLEVIEDGGSARELVIDGIKF